MKRKGIVFVALVFALAIFGFTPLMFRPVLAASWQTQDIWDGSVWTERTGEHLTVTTTNGEWVTDGANTGYNFTGDTKATKSAWQPFDTVTKFTVIVWVTFHDVSDNMLLLGQREAGGYQVRMYFAFPANAVMFQLFTISGVNHITPDNTFTEDSIGKPQMMAFTWDKTDNSGKPETFLNTTQYIATSGMGSTIDAEADLIVGEDHQSGGNINGTMWTLQLFSYKFTPAQVATYYAEGPDWLNGTDYWHSYSFSTGSGSTFYDYGEGWNDEDLWTADLITGSATPPAAWNYQESFYGDIIYYSDPPDIPNVLDFALAAAAVVGLVVMPVTSLTIAIGLKNKDMDRDRFFWLLLVFFLGFCLVVGVGM